MKKLLGLLLVFFQLTTLAQKDYKVIAYYTGDGLSVRQYPVSKITHIIFSFLKLQNDTLTFHNEQQKISLEQIVALKKENPQLKVMVSIGGWSGCAPCSDLFSSAEHRSNFAITAVKLFEEYHIDGIDLDWEYPAIEGYPGHAYTDADKENFTALIQRIREEMGDKYLLSFAAGGFVQYLQRSVEWQKVIPLVDFVNLMTYDLVGGYSLVTGHHTPLWDYNPGQQSVKKCVNWLLEHKVPANKLIIGAAFYARVWQNVADTNHGLYQSGNFLQGVAYKNFDTYFNDTSGYKKYWDKKAKAPFQYNRNKKLFATFDDERSIKAKTRFIRQKKLGGIMFWELIQDKPVNGLVELMCKKLKK